MSSSIKSYWAKYSGLGFGIFFVSTASVLIRFAQNEVPSLVIAAYRLSIAVGVLGIIIVFKGIRVRESYTHRNLRLAMLGGVFLACHFAAWITSLEYTSVASSVVIVTTTPIWVALLSPLLLKESVSKKIIIGLIIALLGMIIVSLSEQVFFIDGRLFIEFGDVSLTGNSILGNFLALIGAFMAAGYMIVGRKIRKDVPSLPYNFVVYGSAAIILDIAVIVSGLKVTGFSQATNLALIGLAILPQLIGHSLFNWALAYLPASLVSIALLGEPVGTIILAAIFLKEAPTIVEIGGALLILLGIVVASLPKRRINVV